MSTTSITSGTSGNVITTTGTPNWSALSGTPTNTAIINNSYLYTGPTIEPTPFSISFAWDNKDVSVRLKNGNDIFKLARIFTEILDKNNIEYEIKTNKKRR